jgi:tRNA threonylcarbamoyladenosine biosynthesis protein TsaE
MSDQSPAASEPDESAETLSRDKARAAEFRSTRAADTQALGRELGRRLEGDQSIGLIGSLGAGKTRFVQGLGRGLGVARVINSPTFVFMKRYRGRLPLIHWDWYRLETEDDLESTGYGDMQVDRGIVAIEWADRFPHRIPKPFLLIEIEHAGPAERRIQMSVQGRSPELERLVASLKEWWRSRAG